MLPDGKTVGAHPDIIEFERVFVARLAKNHGIPVFAHNMVRDSAQQTELFVRGVSKSKAGQSPHNHGMAVDIIHSAHGWDVTLQSWAMLGHIGKEIAVQKGIKLVWGGDWKFYDPAHWELADWRKSKALFPAWPGVRKWRNGSRIPLPKDVPK